MRKSGEQIYSCRSLSHKSMSRIIHLASYDENNPIEASHIFTSNPLHNQKYIGCYGSKKNSKMVYNNFSDISQDSYDTTKLRHIEKASGYDSPRMVDILHNEAVLLQQLQPELLASVQKNINGRIILDKEPIKHIDFLHKLALEYKDSVLIEYCRKVSETHKLLSEKDRIR